jgi:hypothetical protein
MHMTKKLFSNRDYQIKPQRLRGDKPARDPSKEMTRQIDLVAGQVDDRLDMGLIYLSRGRCFGYPPRSWLKQHRDLVNDVALYKGMDIDQVVFDPGGDASAEILVAFQLGAMYHCYLIGDEPDTYEWLLSTYMNGDRANEDPFFAAESNAHGLMSMRTTCGFSLPDAAQRVIETFVSVSAELFPYARERVLACAQRGVDGFVRLESADRAPCLLEPKQQTPEEWERGEPFRQSYNANYNFDSWNENLIDDVVSPLLEVRGDEGSGDRA